MSPKIVTPLRPFAGLSRDDEPVVVQPPAAQASASIRTKTQERIVFSLFVTGLPGQENLVQRDLAHLRLTSLDVRP